MNLKINTQNILTKKTMNQIEVIAVESFDMKTGKVSIYGWGTLETGRIPDVAPYNGDLNKVDPVNYPVNPTNPPQSVRNLIKLHSGGYVWDFQCWYVSADVWRDRYAEHVVSYHTAPLPSQIYPMVQ